MHGCGILLPSSLWGCIICLSFLVFRSGLCYVFDFLFFFSFQDIRLSFKGDLLEGVL